MFVECPGTGGLGQVRDQHPPWYRTAARYAGVRRDSRVARDLVWDVLGDLMLGDLPLEPRVAGRPPSFSKKYDGGRMTYIVPDVRDAMRHDRCVLRSTRLRPACVHHIY